MLRGTRWLAMAVPFIMSMTACDKEKAVKLETDREKAGYSLGQSIGNNLKNQGVDIDGGALAAGLQDALAGKEGRMKKEEMQTALQNLQQAAMKKMGEAMEKNKEQGEKNKKEGEEFLAKNKEKEGVKTTKSGLQYEVVAEGKGAAPKDSDKVVVHYTGKLINGTKFDSSVDRGEPAEFMVGGVIPGWTEALKLMKPGAKYKLTIPSDLAYGPSGNHDIPPNSVLQFDVELIEVKKQ